jgi:hypothetical protein
LFLFTHCLKDKHSDYKKDQQRTSPRWKGRNKGRKRKQWWADKQEAKRARQGSWNDHKQWNQHFYKQEPKWEEQRWQAPADSADESDQESWCSWSEWDDDWGSWPGDHQAQVETPGPIIEELPDALMNAEPETPGPISLSLEDICMSIASSSVAAGSDVSLSSSQSSGAAAAAAPAAAPAAHASPAAAPQADQDDWFQCESYWSTEDPDGNFF